MFLLERLQFIKATIADFIRPFGVCQQSTTDTDKVKFPALKAVNQPVNRRSF
jgi:hypothetical protein